MLKKSFTRDVQGALGACTEIIPLHKSNHLGLNRREKELIRLKNTVKKNWAIRRREEDRVRLRDLERQVREAIIEARRRNILEKVEKSNRETGNCWDLLRALGRGGPPRDAPLKEGDRFIFNSKEKAELAASFLEEVFTNNKGTDSSIQVKADRIQERLLGFSGALEQRDFPRVSTDRVASVLKLKRKKSAPGEDRISYRVLGGLHRNALDQLRRIFVASLRLGEVPACWKTATVVLIPKGGKDPGRLANLRPISLINSMAKLLESIVKEELQDHLEENRSFPATQFGFRAGLCATQQALHLAEAIAKAGRMRKAVALFDLEKAYDKVWRAGLLYKLVRQKVPPWCLRWLANWLSGRTFRVTMGGEVSEYRQALEGLPQGSPLSPCLFNVFVGDLPEAIRVPGTQVFQFADDTAILTSGRTGISAVSRLEKASSKLFDFFRTWKMSANVDKTEVMFPGKKKPKVKSVRIGGTHIKVKRKIKYLGVVLDDRGTMAHHVKQRVGLVKLRLGKLFPVLRWESGVDIKTRLKILKMVAMPSAFYGMEVAIRGSSAAKIRMATAQRVMIRRCLGAPWFVPNRLLYEAIEERNDILEIAEERRSGRIESIRGHADNRVREVADLFG